MALRLALGSESIRSELSDSGRGNDPSLTATSVGSLGQPQALGAELVVDVACSGQNRPACTSEANASRSNQWGMNSRGRN